MRVFTSRLIGRDHTLVLHGGGNTSVKTTATDLLGDELQVLAVKGSGWDLIDIEPPGLPLVEMPPLRRLLELDSMTDEQMVNEVRRQLLDSKAPNPSVETLLHAALPHKFVDHTHANAIVEVTNQPDGEALIREALGDRVAILPWIMPGFPLSKAVAEAYAANPEVEGIVLLQHGIFTFSDDPKESYDRMIDLVSAVEDFATKRIARPLMTAGDAPAVPEDVTAMLNNVRGALSLPTAGAGEPQRVVCSWRDADDLRAFTAHAECQRLVELGPLTPDHVIRTKGRYLYLTQEQARSGDAIRSALADYAAAYKSYFEANKHRVAMPPTMLDTQPRVVIVAGVGILAFGTSAGAASIAADIAEHTLRSKARAEGFGAYTELPQAELFDMEYWSLEQAKMGKKQAPLLAGQVALVTGGGGGIGSGVCASLARAGAAVAVAEIDAASAEAAVKLLQAKLGKATLLPVVMNVTDPESVAAGFAAVTKAFGGIDIIVPNAGIAHVSTLRDMAPADFKRVLDVNLTGTMTVLHEAARVFAAQRTGGSVVVQASKNVFAPGASFGAYSASKAGQHQLGKIAALEFAELGVRVNMINADAVFGDDVPSGLWAEVGPDRMKSRGLDEQGLRDYYRDRSLLKIAVTPEHVGEAVVFLASEKAAATTGVTFTVDGGVAAAFPR